MAGRVLNQLQIVETYAQTADALHIGLIAQFAKRDAVVSRKDRMVRAWASACVKAEALADALNEINTQLKTRHAKRLKYEAEQGGLRKRPDTAPLQDVLEAIDSLIIPSTENSYQTYSRSRGAMLPINQRPVP